MIVHNGGSVEGFSVWMDHVITSPPLATYTLHAFTSDAWKLPLPFSDSSVSSRPAFLSSVRSMSMSLPRYHHVEMPMPAPNEPIMKFSCQKHPASLTTVLVKRPGPAAAFTSSSDTRLQSPLWNPRATAACGGFGCAVPHAARPPVTAIAAIAAISRGVRDTLVITDPTTTFSPAGFERSGTDRSPTHRASAPT